MNQFLETFVQSLSGEQLILFLVLMIWSLIWKGLALWRAASKRDLFWFVIIFVINTLGILEILYLRVWSKRTDKQTGVTES